MYGTHFGVVHVCNDLFTESSIYIVEVECDTGILLTLTSSRIEMEYQTGEEK